MNWRTGWMMLVLAGAVVLGGCSESFPDEEAHLGLEDKIRPYAITLDPPEAAPGETVTVTLVYHSPRPAAVAADWRVALDFDEGLYEVDQVERRVIGIDGVPAAMADANGFCTQTVSYVVPDSTLLWSSAIPDELNDEVMLGLLDLMPELPLSDPPRKTEVAALLRDLDATDLAAMDPDEAAFVQRLADLFACAIRFRVTLVDQITVDVTRNLTVRHSGRLVSPNTNTNAVIARFAVGDLALVDYDLDKLDEVESEIVWHEFDETSSDGLPQATVTKSPDHTYFVRIHETPELYSSPFEARHDLVEQIRHRWYYYRLDAPGSTHQFLVTDEGDEAEMYELDEDVRLDLPGGDSEYRLVSVVRDERGEWARYHATPGTAVTVGVVVFEVP